MKADDGKRAVKETGGVSKEHARYRNKLWSLAIICHINVKLQNIVYVKQIRGRSMLKILSFNGELWLIYELSYNMTATTSRLHFTQRN